jgi:hypothetical protein
VAEPVAGTVEVVGDLFEAPAGQIALEDLDDDGCLIGLGNEP